MPRILVTCPTSGETVPTGHRSPALDLDTLEGERAFRCPRCQKVHQWTAADATIEETLSLAIFRDAA